MSGNPDKKTDQQTFAKVLSALPQPLAVNNFPLPAPLTLPTLQESPWEENEDKLKIMAAQGDPYAQTRLARIYYCESNQFDRNEALHWLKLAKKQADQSVGLWAEG